MSETDARRSHTQTATGREQDGETGHDDESGSERVQRTAADDIRIDMFGEGDVELAAHVDVHAEAEQGDAEEEKDDVQNEQDHTGELNAAGETSHDGYCTCSCPEDVFIAHG